MLLIHTALFAEAKSIIEYLKLKFISKKPYRVYKNSQIILVVTGMGDKTYLLKEILPLYPIKRAINIGIAGCKEKSVPIGRLFCTTHHLNTIAYASISCVDKGLENPNLLSTTLVDMESRYFLEVTKEIDEVYIFKVVSDYLDTTTPTKQFVWRIIGDNLDKIGYYFDHARVFNKI